MKEKNKELKVVTHSGNFHADDVFAVALLKLLFGPFELVRTREEDLIKTGDFVVDVGGIYDSKKDRFDHHQPEGAGKRDNGIPYSSLGLVWKKYGKKLCGSEAVALFLDKKFVQQIDAVDNGFDIAKPIVSVPFYDISSLIAAWNPRWDETKDMDEAFNDAVEMAKQILNREIIKTKSQLRAEKFVKKAYDEAGDKRIIVLNKGYDWHDTVLTFPESLFVISPKNGNWHLSAVRKDTNGFELKKPLPADWGGKRDEELAKITGVSDAIFCHRNLFLAVAHSKEGIHKLASMALG